MRILPIMLGILLLAGSVSAVRALPPPQRTDGLDQPLLGANMCGAGDPGDVQFTLAATGDTFPHENIQAAGEANGYDYLFDHVRPFLQAADLAYTNFDGAMLASSPYTGYPAFNYNPALAGALKRAGIGLVSTANNHILDQGAEGLDATLQVLAQAGIQQHGTVASGAADQPRPPFLLLTLTQGSTSIKLAFLSFTWGTNGMPDAHNQVNLLWQSNEYGQQGSVRQQVLDTVAQARRAADIVVVAAHWGYEYQFFPDDAQIVGAQALAAAGADIILGAQSHTLQPVDLLRHGDRTTLVIYSLANFLASQGAFQAESYSATSVIFYVGITRSADGRTRVSGYRYLPTIHVDGDTRPAPIPVTGYDDVIAHVRAEMRDPDGLRQVPPSLSQPPARMLICQPIALPDAPQLPIGGDFAQYLATLGGTAPRDLADAQLVLGAPLGPVAPALAGDCQTTTTVLLTERQRLELHPELDWPYRVSGTQLGAAVYQQRYSGPAPARRTNLSGGAIADARFAAFFAAYGGLPVFGYPISELLRERGAQGTDVAVQYFERARFELVPGAAAAAPLTAQVRLGALGREFAGIEQLCGKAIVEPTIASVAVPATRLPAAFVSQPAMPAVAAPRRAWWFWPALSLNILLLAATALWGWRLWATLRRRRSGPVYAPVVHRPRRVQSDAELLRELLSDDEPG